MIEIITALFVYDGIKILIRAVLAVLLATYSHYVVSSVTMQEEVYPQSKLEKEHSICPPNCS